VITYSVRATGTSLQRVKLLLNGEVAEDSGPINRSSYQHEYTTTPDAGKSYRAELAIDAPGARAPNVISLTSCGNAPTGPRA
jgi:hypothetical protein